MDLYLSRRALLAGSAASLACPPWAFAAPLRHRITVLARGGWDPSCVFDPKIWVSPDSCPDRDRGGAQEAIACFGDLSIAVHPYKRPAVQRFFADYREQIVVINGISVGTTDHQRAMRQVLSEAELQGARSLDEPVDSLLDASARSAHLVVDSDLDWDTHGDSSLQHVHFQALFARLQRLVDGLWARDRLAETLVVVLSELGRAPQQNVHGGKDHWPVTSALLVGGSIEGGRRLGGTDEAMRPLPVDPITGRISRLGRPLQMSQVREGIEAHLHGGGGRALRLA